MKLKILLEVNKIAGNSRGGTIKLFQRKNEALSMIARPTASKTRRRSNNGGPRERAQGRSHVVVIQCFPDLTVLRSRYAISPLESAQTLDRTWIKFSTRAIYTTLQVRIILIYATIVNQEKYKIIKDSKELKRNVFHTRK